MKKGKFEWIIVNRWGNYWDGKSFVMGSDFAKKYKCHGKALLALHVAKATIKDKVDKLLVELKPIAITKLPNTFADWLAEQDF